MPSKFLGLDITDSSIAAVLVTSTLKGYQITSCAHVTIEEDDGLNSALGNLFEQADLKCDVCNSSIPEGFASFRNIQLPFKDPKKILQTLPFELETMLPFPIEDMVVDFSTIDRSNQSDILAASIKKTEVSHHLDQLQPHGVDPDAIDIRCVPTVSWLLKQKETPDNGIFLQIDGKKTTMVLFFERRIVLVRTFFSENSFHLDTDSNTAVHDTTEQVDAYFKSFCTQVQSTIHSFGYQNNKDIHLEKVLFSGHQTLLVDAKQRLNQFLNTPAEQIDLSKNDKINKERDVAQAWSSNDMNNALALALRDSKHDHGFNFRKNGFEKKKHYFGPQEELQKTAIFFIVLLCFLVVNMGVDYHLLKQRDSKLDHKIRVLLKDTMPHVTKIQKFTEVDTLKTEISKIKKTVSLPAADGKNSVLDLLMVISDKIPEALDIHMTRMNIDTEAIRLSGTTDTFNTVDKIKNDLESSNCFKTVAISSAKLGRTGDKVEFEIKLERAI